MTAKQSGGRKRPVHGRKRPEREDQLLAKRFGNRVRAARITRGMSQASIAKQIGISSNHVGVIERGETVPSLETVQAFAKAFGITMGELLDGEMAGDAWLKKVAAIAEAVPPSKRALLLSLLAAVVVAITRSDSGAEPADLETARRGMDELLERSLSFAPDDPRISVIIDLLRGRTTPEIEQALAVIKALK